MQYHHCTLEKRPSQTALLLKQIRSHCDRHVRLHSPLPSPLSLAPKLIVVDRLRAASQMEGLIPLIYKAVKERRSRSRSRSYSRCSSAGSAAGRFGSADVAVGEQQKQWGVALRAEPGAAARTEDGGSQHRRHRSLEELAGEVGSAPEWRAGGMPRGRSVRIFSCIGGGM